MVFEKNNNRDLFGNPLIEKPIEVVIYADEAIDRKCPFTGNNWHYICLIVERLDTRLLKYIISERYCNNSNQSSPYFKKK